MAHKIIFINTAFLLLYMGNRWSGQAYELECNGKFIEPVSDSKFRWIPSIGEIINFFIGKMKTADECKGITNYLQTSRTYEVPLELPDANLVCNAEHKTIDSHTVIESAVKYLLSETDFLTELAVLSSKGSDIIGANCGRFWEDEPVRCLRSALNENGYVFEDPPVYAKIGGRNRYQTHGIHLIRETAKPQIFNYQANELKIYFWAGFQLPSH